MATTRIGNANYAQIRIETHRADIGHRVFWAKVDRADYPRIVRHIWHVTSDGNSINPQTRNDTDEQRGTISMGRLVMGWGDLGNLGRIDYRNSNPLDCRRANLRIVTQSQILAKRKPAGGASRFKGVAWDAKQQKWLATFNGHKIGRFGDERDAARAFDDAAIEAWGEDAYLNFPPEGRGTPMTAAKARLLGFAIRACLDTQPVQDDNDYQRTLHTALAFAERWSN